MDVNELPSRPAGNPLSISLRVVVLVTVSVYGMVATIVFSFLPQMIKSFGVSEVDTGFYAGIVGSSIYVGRFIFSMLWGYLADVKGKKFSSLLAQILLFITTVAFGFSRDIYWATVTRFLQGSCMGQYVIAAAMIASVCDENSIAEGMSIAISSVSVGFTLGPSVGGFFAFPSLQYPEVFTSKSVFHEFGVLLPTTVLSTGLFIGIILTMIYIPKDTTEPEEKTSLLASTNSTYYGSVNVGVGNHVRFTTLDKIKSSNLIKVLRTKDFLLSCFIYGFFSVIDIGFLEIFPVLAATTPKYNGMGFTSSQIGIVLMVSSLCILPLQMLLLPKLDTRFGSKKVVICCNSILVFVWPLLPAVAFIRNKILLWPLLLLLIFASRILVFLTFLSINVLLNNSVVAELRGLANGIGMSVACLGRLIAPLIAGTIYSWSLSNIKGIDGNINPLGFPLNQFFIFFLFSVMSVFMSIFTRFL